jgi:glucose-6-phosphate isomerase
MNASQLWARYQKYLCSAPSLNLSLDISRMTFDDGFLAKMEPLMTQAYSDMDDLEAGKIVNPDEQRMVGHYWLRAADLAPTAELKAAIKSTVADIHAFANDVHSGKIKPQKAAKFTTLLSIGIGGSALGPMFVSDALTDPATDKLQVYFIDNTDPDGIDRVLRQIGSKLSETLTLVISKSGGTPEPRNGMLVAKAAYEAAGLDFGAHAVATTGEGSNLDKYATQHKWLKRFPMWDWVGGRTSELSTVGLVGAALQGFDIDAMLKGAAETDIVTRVKDTTKNPAALLALMWYHATDGKGKKDMVVLPYKDRLLLFSRYLQQLLMESLGKQLDLKGQRVDQGIAVYGNKGSTDQHAYVQQLRDGVNNFFVVFIRVLEEGGKMLEVEPGVTPGDYLHGFLLGTRTALFENDRQSVTITVPRADARSIGILIALFERAVSFYATLVGINAYHQPGVEAGKKAAASVLAVQSKVVATLSATPHTADQLAAAAGLTDSVETVFFLLEHLAANGKAKIAGGSTPTDMTFAKA